MFVAFCPARLSLRGGGRRNLKRGFYELLQDYLMEGTGLMKLNVNWVYIDATDLKHSPKKFSSALSLNLSRMNSD